MMKAEDSSSERYRSPAVAWLQERLYHEPALQDPVKRFLRVVDHYVQPAHNILDMGAGAGEINRYSFKGNVREVVGIDLDPRVLTNPLLDRGVVGNILNLPFSDKYFDSAFCIYVVEHIEKPSEFISEVRRVLKPGGVFLALTPNRYHYVSLISSLTPTSFHAWYNQKRGRSDDDTFPTHYRLNTLGTMRRQFGKEGFEEIELSTIEVQPNYLMFSWVPFLLGAAYERLVNSSTLFSSLRVNIIGVFKKRE